MPSKNADDPGNGAEVKAPQRIAGEKAVHRARRNQQYADEFMMAPEPAIHSGQWPWFRGRWCGMFSPVSFFLFFSDEPQSPI